MSVLDKTLDHHSGRQVTDSHGVSTGIDTVRRNWLVVSGFQVFIGSLVNKHNSQFFGKCHVGLIIAYCPGFTKLSLS